MKYLVLLAIIAVIGCKPKVECRDYQRSMLFFDSRDTIPDTVLFLEVHQKNSNFSNRVDSGRVEVACFKSHELYKIAVSSSDLKRYQFNQYDWLYTFYPSGKQIRETEITFHKRKKQVYGDGADDAICGNNLTYKANDSLYSVPGGDGSNSLTAYEHIKYWSSFCLVEYSVEGGV